MAKFLLFYFDVSIQCICMITVFISMLQHFVSCSCLKECFYSYHRCSSIAYKGTFSIMLNIPENHDKRISWWIKKDVQKLRISELNSSCYLKNHQQIISIKSILFNHPFQKSIVFNYNFCIFKNHLFMVIFSAWMSILCIFDSSLFFSISSFTTLEY